MSAFNHTPTAGSGEQAIANDVLLPDASLDAAIGDRSALTTANTDALANGDDLTVAIRKTHTRLAVATDADGTLKAGAVDGAAVLANDVVTTAKILNANVTTDKIADANVTTAKIADANVTVDKLAANAVTQAKIADNAVGTAEIIDLNVTTGKLADLGVTGPKIAANAIDQSKIGDAAVGTAELINLNVTTGKLADDAVTGPKIADSAILPIHLDPSVQFPLAAFGPFDFPEDFGTGAVPNPYTERGAGNTILFAGDGAGAGELAMHDSEIDAQAAGTPEWGEPAFRAVTGIARAPGLAFAQRVRATVDGQYFAAVLRNSTAITALSAVSNESAGWNLTTGSVTRVHADGVAVDLGLPDSSNDHVLTTVLRDTAGAFWFRDDEFVWFSQTSPSGATFYPMFLNQSATTRTDYLYANILPSPFSDDQVFGTSDLTPTDGQTVQGPTDFMHYIEWTPAVGEVLSIYFRGDDDNNTQVIRFSEPAGTCQLFNIHESVETAANFTGHAFAAGVISRIMLRGVNDTLALWINGSTKTNSWVHGYGLGKTRFKVSGFTTAANWLIAPYVQTGKTLEILSEFQKPHPYRPGNIIDVPDGADLDTYAALMRPGDTLRLAQGGLYDLGAAVQGLQGFESGFPWQPSRIEGRGATIRGGVVGIRLTNKRWFEISDLRLIDQANHSLYFNGCRNFTVSRVYMKSTSNPGGFIDPTRFQRCRDGRIEYCTADTSLGNASCDGFECLESCLRIVYFQCVARGMPANGYETWSSTSVASGHNVDITYIECEADSNGGVGFTSEGSDKFGVAPNIIVVGCNSHDNVGVGYQGIEGQTLIRRGCIGTNGAGVQVDY